MNIEQKGVNCTWRCITIGMLVGFGSQCRSRTNAEVPKRDASSMVIEESKSMFGQMVFKCVVTAMAPIQSQILRNWRYREDYKKAASQG